MFHWCLNKSAALKEIYRVLKPGGQVALRFNGGDFGKEFLEILMKLEEQNPEYSMTPTWKEIQKQHGLSIEDVLDLFDSVGFKPTYPRRSFTLQWWINWWNDPNRERSDAFFSFWQIGFSDKVVAEVKEKRRKEMRNQMASRGFKITIDLITAYGTKPE